MAEKVSLKDIAQKAGVSVTLVSYVLNNQHENRINKETAKKIRSIANKLNYHTNQIARSLKTNKTHTIGLIIGDISNPFFSALARIVEDEADKKNYTVIFGSSDENEEKFAKLIRTFVNRQVDGLIIAPPQDSEKHLLYLQKKKIPFVLIDRYFPTIKADYVVLDNFEATYNAVQHLITTGIKRIGMITYKTGLAHLLDRKAGYLEALKDNKIKFAADWLKEVEMNSNIQQVEAAVSDLLNKSAQADAILFTSNSIATNAVKYINTLPVKVPEMLSLICFDETEALDLFYAPLTYIKQPLQEIGQATINLLLEKLSSKKKISQINIKAELVIRKSTLA